MGRKELCRNKQKNDGDDETRQMSSSGSPASLCHECRSAPGTTSRRSKCGEKSGESLKCSCKVHLLGVLFPEFPDSRRAAEDPDARGM